VGRTARGEGGVGHALLILRPEELGFLRFLKQARVPLNEFEFSWSKVSDIQLQVGHLGLGNYYAFMYATSWVTTSLYMLLFDMRSLPVMESVIKLNLEITTQSILFSLLHLV